MKRARNTPAADATGRRRARARPAEQARRPKPVAGTRRLLRELKACQSKLEAQSRELRRVRDELRAALRGNSRRRESDRILRESERKYRQLVEATDTGYTIIDERGYVLDANSLYVHLTGRSRLEEVIGHCVLEWTAPHDHKRNALEIQRCVQQGSVRGLEIDYATPDGHIKQVDISATVIEGARGLQILSLCRDTAERKRVERSLWEHQQTLSAIVESSQDWIWAMDLNGHHTYSNHAVEKILGFTPEEFQGMGLELVHPSDQRVIEAQLPGWIAARRGWQDIVLRWRTKDGSYRYLESTAVPILGPQGELEGFRGVDRDITKRKQAEAALQHSISLLRATLESTADGILVVDLEGKIVDFNRQFLDLWHVPSDLISAGRSRDLITSGQDQRMMQVVLEQLKDPAGFAAKIKELYAHPEADSFDALEFKDGRIVERYSHPQRMEGQAIGRVWSFRDITERRRAEGALKASEHRYRELVEHQNEGIGIVDAHEHFVFSNPAGDEIFGMAPGSLVGHTLKEFTAADQYARVLKETNLRRQGNRSTYELEITRPDGQRRWLLVTATPRTDERGRFTSAFGVFRDITERKRAEGELRQLTGQLLRLQDEERRRIARELHDATAQEMTALSLNLTLLSSQLPDMTAKTREVMDRTKAMADQCATGIRTLAYLLHPPLLDELGLGGAARDFSDGFAQRSGIRVALDLPAHLERVPREIELALFRILQESLTNVHRHSNSKTVSVTLGQSPHEIWLEVQDQGKGLPALDDTHPEFASARSLGVGISGMRERMRQLGGRLEAESGPGGTTVRAVVPLGGGAA